MIQRLPPEKLPCQLRDHEWCLPELIGPHVFGGEGVESIWVTDVGDVRLLLTGAATPEEFRILAEKVGAAQPITP